MKNEFLKKNKLLIFTLFFLLTVDTGLYSLSMINGTIRIAMVAVAIVILIFSRFQKTIFSHDFAVRLKRSFAFFVISLVMPIIYGKDNVKQMVIFLVAMTIGYLFTLFIRYDDFKELLK